MNPRITLLFLALSAPAAASSLVVDGSVGIDLRTSKVTQADGADVHVRPLIIEAEHGIRPEGSDQPFQTAAPIVLGRRYVVRDAAAAQYRLVVVAYSEDARWIEVEPLDLVALPVPVAVPNAALAARSYRASSARIDGAVVAGAGLDLQLLVGGTYRVGNATGRWSIEPEARETVLDGFYARWGRGRFSLDGATVTFRFLRARALVELVLTAEDAPAMSVAGR